MLKNEVTIAGTIDSDFVANKEFSIDDLGKRFVGFTVRTERLSGTADIVPIISEEQMLESQKSFEKHILIKGSFRSYNPKGSKHLSLYVYPEKIQYINGKINLNEIQMEGMICKVPTIRRTPQGRLISDLIVAVHREDGNVDFIPCIAWGDNAIIASNLSVATFVRIEGRIQSRNYIKEEMTKTAYEISINKIGMP